jgi:hypothetical protein
LVITAWRELLADAEASHARGDQMFVRLERRRRLKMPSGAVLKPPLFR